MRVVRAAVAAMYLLLFALVLQGQAVSVVRLDYSNPGLTPAHWTLTVHPDGSGHFRSERGSAPAAYPQDPDSPRLTAPDLDRDIQLSAQFAGHVFQVARDHKWFNQECESHLKVAFRGQKTLTYSGPEGQGSCEFNFARDKEIESLDDSLEAVAATVLEGARLESLLQHDRLGLDAEMEYLTAGFADGQLQQPGAIRGILGRLAEDPGVMERVRKRARALLAKVEE